jgi:glyoxylase-like metal-dependent hydrolase (beta-lactamase superfamily II)
MRIHAFSTGSVRIRPSQVRGSGPGPLRRLNVLRDPAWTEPLPIHAWAIEHPEGLILVDTGEVHEASDPHYFPAAHPFYRRSMRADITADDEIDARLRQAGLDPDDVRWVVVTHLHTDHAGGLRHFPAAEIVLSADEWAAGRGLGGWARGYLPHLFPRWLAPRTVVFTGERVGEFAASHPLTEAGDVVLVPTPGHTHGHLSVLVHRPGEPDLLLAGDASFTEQVMLDGVVDGVAIDARAARETLARLQRHTRSRPTVYLPAHDPRSADRFAAGQTVAP